MTSPTSSANVRQHLLDAMAADFVGPFQRGGDGKEVLPLPPSRWYMTGFLAPLEGRMVDDPTQDDELGSGDEEDA